MDEAAMLMDRPSGGWDQLVTKEVLHLELAALKAELKVDLIGEMERRFRVQTWSLMSTVLAAMGIVVAAVRF